MNKDKLKKAFAKSGKSLWNSTPILLGTILLISLVSLIPKNLYTKVFTTHPLLNGVIGALIGSISAGNPITSYVLGGELLKEGIGLIAITAFLVSWVTVGIIQFPAEATILGRKFAIWRNISAFILSIIVAIVVVILLNI